MSDKNEIAAVSNSGFLQVVNLNESKTAAEELAGLDLSFERIKIPAGGGLIFEVPGETEDAPESVKEFSAVILCHQPVFSYYKEKYTGGSNPPDCGSFDGIVGVGNPGGNCKTCPLNQFGSGENNAKACKNRRRIYILREGELFPVLLSLPTGSVKSFTKYLQKQILGKGKEASYAVVTKFGLKKAVNAGGIAYSQATFSVDRDLTADELAAIRPMVEQVRAMSQKVGYELDEPVEDAIVVDPETGEIIAPLN